MLHHHPFQSMPRYDELEHLRMELDQEERLKYLIVLIHFSVILLFEDIL